MATAADIATENGTTSLGRWLSALRRRLERSGLLSSALFCLWLDESQPIYRQLRDRVVAMMLEGTLKEGEALPSVRQVATEYRLNPLTILKAYQQLSDEGLVEKRRGLGMFVAPGASAALMKDERQRFLVIEWPRIHATIRRLGLSTEALLNSEPASAATPPLPTRTEQK
jgi:GntR family transcriptional regulator